MCDCVYVLKCYNQGLELHIIFPYKKTFPVTSACIVFEVPYKVKFNCFPFSKYTIVLFDKSF